MATQSIGTRATPVAGLRDYLLAYGVREHPQLAKLRTETAPLRGAGMQISPEQGAFMGLLAELLGVRRYLEVGVFTGYSSLAMALAMPTDGRITALDVSKEWTDIARKHWAAAGVAHKIDLRLGPGTESLAALVAAGESGRYDMAFIDADKTSYPTYYERALELVHTGGLIAIDNTFHGGRVADPSRATDDTRAIDALNRELHTDDRVTLAMTPIGDGLTLLRKR